MEINMTMLTFPALVIRECDYAENDKLLTLLTAEKGKITVCAKGAKSIRNKDMACSQLLCYSEFTVKERGGYYTLSEASLIEQFFGLRSSLERNAAAVYIADVAGEVCVENNDESRMLSLTLNTLYMLSETDRNVDFIKAVFELRCASVSGFCPELSGCTVCGRKDAPRLYLDVMDGSLICGDCFGADDEEISRGDVAAAKIILPLSSGLLEAMRYVVSCPPKKIFSFSLPNEELSDFCRVCEKYLINQIERSFSTLEFYNRIKAMSLK